MPTIKLRKLHPEVLLPAQGTPGSIGLDLHAHLLTEHGRPNNQLLPAHATRLIPTGLQIEPCATQVDSGDVHWLVTVCSRSGLAAKSLFVANAPGIIDPDYSGEIKILLYNGSMVSTHIHHGDRIAQLVCLSATLPELLEVEEILETTVRGKKGMGSTGR